MVVTDGQGVSYLNLSIFKCNNPRSVAADVIQWNKLYSSWVAPEQELLEDFLRTGHPGSLADHLLDSPPRGAAPRLCVKQSNLKCDYNCGGTGTKRIEVSTDTFVRDCREILTNDSLNTPPYNHSCKISHKYNERANYRWNQFSVLIRLKNDEKLIARQTSPQLSNGWDLFGCFGNFENKSCKFSHSCFSDSFYDVGSQKCVRPYVVAILYISSENSDATDFLDDNYDKQINAGLRKLFHFSRSQSCLETKNRDFDKLLLFYEPSMQEDTTEVTVTNRYTPLLRTFLNQTLPYFGGKRTVTVCYLLPSGDYTGKINCQSVLRYLVSSQSGFSCDEILQQNASYSSGLLSRALLIIFVIVAVWNFQ